MIKSCYIHIPFCKKICSYCDFCKNYYNELVVDGYLDNLKKEISKNYKNEVLDTLYIGGGTPSSLSSKNLNKLIYILKTFKLNHDYEYTFECNYEDINEKMLLALKSGGVNRISIGIQTFNEKYSKVLNRDINKKKMIENINLAKRYFSNINIDLMYALPGESINDLKSDLEIIKMLDVSHISTYALIIEEHTNLKLQNIKETCDDIQNKMYYLILDYLKNNNYKTLTMDEFYNWKIGNLNLPYKSVLITFDDGFLSNYEYAFKLLKEYNMNATVFVVGSFIDNSTTNEWNGNIKTYMTKDILENLKNEYPNIEIYSHSYNLHYQGAINQNKDVLMQDIENFDNFYPNTDILCYPFGQYNDNIEDCLKESNYKMAFRYGPNKKDYKKASRNDNIYEIPRLNVSHGMSVFKFALRLFMYN